MAELLDVSHSLPWFWESGKANIPDHFRFRLARILGASELLTEEIK